MIYGIFPSISSWKYLWERLIQLESILYPSVQFSSVSSVAQSCLTNCDSVNCSTPGFPVQHQLSELAQTIRVVSSAYLCYWYFSQLSFFPACASSIPAFHMMYSVYKLNHQGDNIQPFPIWNQSMSGFNCCFSTCIQISQEAGKVIWYSHLKEFSTFCCDLHSQRL